MSADTPIRYDVVEGIATITFNRPDKMNTLTRPLISDLIGLLDRADADDAVKAVIITGEGRAFCAGADLTAGAETFDYDKREQNAPETAQRDWGGLLTLRIFRNLKPVIGAVNGAAVGIGATMLLPMDVRVASTSAKVGFVFARRGIVPEAASSWFLPRIVGISTAIEWASSGRVVGAEELKGRGLFRSLYAPDELLAAARKIAHEMTAESAPVSVSLTRQMMWRMLGAAHPMEAHRVDSRAVHARGKSADAREGVSSFLEKRTAVFTDKVSDGLPDVFPEWIEPEFR